MDSTTAKKKRVPTLSKVRPVFSNVRGVQRNLTGSGTVARHGASDEVRGGSAHRVGGTRTQKKRQPSPPPPLVLQPTACGRAGTRRHSSGSSVRMTEAECFLTQLALEDCLFCLENLQCMLSGNHYKDKNVRGTECKCLQSHAGFNPLRTRRRPLLSIAEDLSQRLNELTDGYVSPLKTAADDGETTQVRTQMEGSSAALAEDTFGRLEETQYSLLGTFGDIVTDGNAVMEWPFFSRFLENTLSTLNTDEISTVTSIRSTDAWGNEGNAFADAEGDPGHDAVVKVGSRSSRYLSGNLLHKKKDSAVTLHI